MNKVEIPEVGRGRLLKDGAEAEEFSGKSCLRCRHFQMRYRSEIIICTKKPNTIVPVEVWGKQHAETAKHRARHCRDFDEMRPE